MLKEFDLNEIFLEILGVIMLCTFVVLIYHGVSEESKENDQKCLSFHIVDLGVEPSVAKLICDIE